MRRTIVISLFFVFIVSQAWCGVCDATYRKYGFYACMGGGCSHHVIVYSREEWKELLKSSSSSKFYEKLAEVLAGMPWSCSVVYKNGVGHFDCGSWQGRVVLDSSGEITSFTVEGPFTVFLSKKILVMANKQGIEFTPSINFVQGFVKFIMASTKKYIPQFMEEEKIIPNAKNRFLATVSFLSCVTGNADIVDLQLLNKLIRDYLNVHFPQK